MLRVHWLPVILAIYMPITFIITYSIAVANEHVNPVFPYISDTGNSPPASCIFGQLMNIGAILCAAIVYIRYRYVHHFMNKSKVLKLQRLNTIAFAFGLTSSLGISLVGNIQASCGAWIHFLIACSTFGVGFVYCVLQTGITYNINEGTKKQLILLRLRASLCIVDAILLVVCIVSTTLATAKGPGDGIAHYNWTRRYPGYAEHLVSTISEWLVALVCISYFATFYTEFKQFRLEQPQLIFPSSEMVNGSNRNRGFQDDDYLCHV